jgi:hypothetical protein
MGNAFRFLPSNFRLEEISPFLSGLQSFCCQTLQAWKLPYPEGFGPLTHVVSLAADIRWPTIMVAADLLHKECNAQISAFFSQTPDPFWFHTACTWPRLAAADDPVGNAFARLELQRAKGRFVRHEFDGGADAGS